MIHVNRGPAPLKFARRAGLAFQKVTSFYKQPDALRAQHRAPYDPVALKPARQRLFQVFHGKCGYCESPLEAVQFAIVENYRPKSRYWWLTYSWDNLLIACQACNSAKADRFPLEDDSKRATNPSDDLVRENPLLLNPCQDQPQEHLVFDDQGMVFSSTARGQSTIDVLGLNRDGLVTARQRCFREMLAGLEIGTSRKASEFLLSLVKDDAPYAAATRQTLVRAMQKLKRTPSKSKWIRDVENSTRGFLGTIESTTKDVEATKSAFKSHERAVESFSLPVPEDQEISQNYFIKRRVINRIEMKNFMGIRDLDITLSDASNQTSSWLMLVGENATGKSSILKALALTLMDQNSRAELPLRPVDVLTHGQKEGHVRLWLTGVADPVELTYRHGNTSFVGTSQQRVLLLGYGSTRLLPPATTPGVRPMGPVRTMSLFDPFARLVDAENVLGSLDPELFGPAARILRQLLPLGQRVQLQTRHNPALAGKFEVFVRIFRDELTLRQLSDGYQSVVALAVDILSTFLPVWKQRVDVAEGIVLLDEIDAHLHPTWRMRIVQTMRSCFPHTQFITTTHDPLCLKGLRRGEVVVLRRTRPGRVRAWQDLPSPEGMSADQLLTSEHFGLGSTVDPEIEKLFRKYYALLAVKDRGTVQERQFVKLKEVLGRLHHMGRTRREQLMLEAIDTYLSEDIPLGMKAQKERRRLLLERLISRWTSNDIYERPA
jgi:uncharacterized protein (TIGR02646 family)